MAVINQQTLRLIADLELDFVLGAAVSEIVNASDGDDAALERAVDYIRFAQGRDARANIPRPVGAPPSKGDDAQVTTKVQKDLPVRKKRAKTKGKRPLTGGRAPRACITCGVEKGVTAFAKGSDECRKCSGDSCLGGRPAGTAKPPGTAERGWKPCVTCGKKKQKGAFPPGSEECRRCREAKMARVS